MEEKEFSPQQSLQLIEKMINTARNRFSENGFMYLLWGWVVFVCGISQFILIHFFQSPYHYFVWMICWPVLAYHIYYIFQQKKKEQVSSYTGNLIGYIWITFTILIFLIGFLIGRLTTGEYYSHINPVILALYGMPVFLSGIVFKFRPLVLGGISCWLLSVITTFIVNYDYQFLMIPLAMLLAWIIPGYLLRSKYKSQ